MTPNTVIGEMKPSTVVATINILIYESNSHHLGNGSQKCVESSEAQTAWCVSLMLVAGV